MATKKLTEVTIKAVELESVPITIVGTTPLITHCWSEKAKKEMRDKQMGVAKKSKHEKKVPVNDFISSLNWLSPMPELGENNAEAEKKLLQSLQKGGGFWVPHRRHQKEFYYRRCKIWTGRKNDRVTWQFLLARCCTAFQQRLRRNRHTGTTKNARRYGYGWRHEQGC